MSSIAKIPVVEIFVGILLINGCAQVSVAPDEARNRAILHRVELARAYGEQGDLSHALMQWKAVIALDPEHPEALQQAKATQVSIAEKTEKHLTKGRKLLRRGRTSRAKQELLRALAVDPANPEALSYLRKTERQGASLFNKNSKKMPPECAECKDKDKGKDKDKDKGNDKELAEKHYRNGVQVYREDIDLGIWHWEQSMKYNPQHANAKMRLRRAYKIKEMLRSIERPSDN